MDSLAKKSAAPLFELSESRQAELKKLINTEPLVLFMKGTPDFPQCGFSSQTVGVLREIGAAFHAVNILEDTALRDDLKKFSRWPTYPQLYIQGELVGGCDIVSEMYQSGELKQLIESIPTT